MRFLPLILLAACGVDYKVHPETPNNGEADTGPTGPAGGEEGGGEPPGEDTEEPPQEEGAPVAICAVSPNPVQPPFEKAAWDGSDSYDPAGGQIVDYNWVLTKQPAGSIAEMPAGQAVRNNFTPDLAGDYVGKLTVTNDRGETDSCEVTLESVPAENLWIELYWSRDTDDMDLHLLKPGGNLESQGDCYFSNCTFGGLEWGAAGAADNPSLDLDDIYGTGPENINIAEPAEGVYTVIVHDYTGSNWPSNDFMGDNSVTVNIYIDGTLEWSETRDISGDGSYTPFATIDWSTGLVESL